MSPPPDTARKSSGRQGLRPLGRPRPLRVTCDALGVPTRVEFPGHVRFRPSGHPASATDASRGVAVIAIDQVWRIAEEWWRETPIARTYYQLRLDDGRALTCFHDGSLSRNDTVSAGAWFVQHY